MDTMAQTLQGLEVQCEALQAIVERQDRKIRTLQHSQPGVFVAAQYNILASYLGDNRQPWFLYGIDLTEERRKAVLAKFYERGSDGKYCNVGWPSYVTGLLSANEIAAVEACDKRSFAWEARKERLLAEIDRIDADLISLVELDRYDEFFKPEMERRGYSSTYKKRPRDSSLDGCGIFWRSEVFSLLDTYHLEFVDRFDPELQSTSKDRVCLLALLQHCAGQRLIFISTHLARNPEDDAQTKNRAKQTAQLVQTLTYFAAKHDAMDAAVLLAGDLNTTNIRQLGNIARAVFEFCDEPVHPFIFNAIAPRSMPTSVTSTRKMTIDYLLMQPTLELVDARTMPALTMDEPIPNASHPSDHLPLVLKLAFRGQRSQLHELARAWVDQLVRADPWADEAPITHHHAPLTYEELTKAYLFFDMGTDGSIGIEALTAGLEELYVDVSADRIIRLLERELGAVGSGRGSVVGGGTAMVGDTTPGRATDEASRATAVGRRRGSSGLGTLYDLASTPMGIKAFRKVYLSCFLRDKANFREEMKEAFGYFDANGSGSLERSELQGTFRDVCPFAVTDELFESIWTTMSRHSQRADGTIDVDAFVDAIVLKQHGQAHNTISSEAKGEGSETDGDMSRWRQSSADITVDLLRTTSHGSHARRRSLLSSGTDLSDDFSEASKTFNAELQAAEKSILERLIEKSSSTVVDASMTKTTNGDAVSC